MIGALVVVVPLLRELLDLNCSRRAAALSDLVGTMVAVGFIVGLG